MSRVSKIRQVKNFGFFKNYTWPSQALNDFNKINLIYGFNGAGKTELTRLLRSLEEQKLPDDDGHKGAEFKIETDNGTTVSESTLDTAPNIKVFNQDFVSDHIELDKASASSFYHLTKLDPEDKKRLEELQEKKGKLNNDLIEIREERQERVKEKEELLSARARAIKEVLSSVNPPYYLNYNRQKAETKLEEFMDDKVASAYSPLSAEQLEDEKIKAVTTSEPDKISDISKVNPPDIDTIDSDISDLLARELSTEAIKEFESNPDLNDWAETGFNLHKLHQSNACLYCTNEISSKRQEALSDHFNKEYSLFADEIDQAIEKLSNNYPTPNIEVTPKDFDKSLIKEASSVIDAIDKACIDWSNAVGDARSMLEKKRKNLNSHPSFSNNLKEEKDNLDKALGDLQTVIDKHNRISRSFGKAKQDAAKKVEEHLIFEILEDTKKHIEFIEKKGDEEVDATRGLEEIEKDISSIEKNATGEGPAIDEINRTIRLLLSRDDIALAPKDDTSFEILRGEVAADTLSEGEQTAVAFAYFCSKLEEKGSVLKKTILVIDDPISSLDHHRLYSVASKVKDITTKAKQTIILTHNYDFFREIKRWLMKKNSKLVDADKEPCANLYFITSNIDLSNNERFPILQDLPVLLRKYDSDYHYNFSEMLKFADGETDTSNAYHMPSMARKFLETFLSFKVPTASELGGLSKLCDDTTQDIITRYLNFSNHADYVERITQLDHATISGAKEAVEAIIGVAEKADKEHINELKKL